MQLVLIGKRVVAHGENFLATGGTVINTVTGAKYENATVAECEGCPSDIDSVGYEYHAGEFKPCAPYGKGIGNLAVLCDRDCKSIKDSGKPLNELFFVNLLWENASPTSTFDAQTVTLASDDWNFLIIESTVGVIMLTENITGTMRTITSDSTTHISESMRTATASLNTVTFSKGWLLQIDADGVDNRNNYSNRAIPLKIYGVKIGVTI